MTILIAPSKWTVALTRWLAFGFAWLLLGMFLLPTSKLYQQGLIFFLWLPGLLALFTVPEVRRAWDVLLLALFAVSVFWAGASISWGGAAEQIKELLYICLALNAVVALAALNPRLLWQVLLGCAVLGGILVWW